MLDEYMDMFNMYMDEGSTSNSKDSKVPDTKSINNTVSSEDVSINNNKITVENPKISLSNPSFDIKIPGVFQAAAVGSSIQAGLKIGRRIPSVAGKMVVVGATAGITTGITAFAQRLGTSAADAITKSNPNSNKFVSNFLPDLNID